MELSQIPGGPLTLGGIISFIILLVLYGKLVPKDISESHQKEAKELRTEVVSTAKTEAAAWKAAYEKERENNALLLEAVQRLTEQTETVIKLLKSLPRNRGGEWDDFPKKKS